MCLSNILRESQYSLQDMGFEGTLLDSNLSSATEWFYESWGKLFKPLNFSVSSSIKWDDNGTYPTGLL